MSDFRVDDKMCIIPGSSPKDRSLEGKELNVFWVFRNFQIGNFQIGNFKVEVDEPFDECSQCISIVSGKHLIHWDKATPCQKLGLAEGDRFELLEDLCAQDTLPRGTTIELLKDMGNDFPWVKVVDLDRSYFLDIAGEPCYPDILEKAFYCNIRAVPVKRLLPDSQEEEKSTQEKAVAAKPSPASSTAKAPKTNKNLDKRWADLLSGEDTPVLSPREKAYQEKVAALETEEKDRQLEAERKLQQQSEFLDRAMNLCAMGISNKCSKRCHRKMVD